MKLWVGIEKEGKYYGMKTLFVGTSNVTANKIISITEHKPDIKQIYFGAGKCTKPSYIVMREIFEKTKGIVITLEVDLGELGSVPDSIIEKCDNIIVTITKKNVDKLFRIDKNRVQVKIQTLGWNKAIGLAPLVHFKTVEIEEHLDKIYKGDEVIE